MKMLVAHSFNQREMQQEISDPKIMLTNGSGSYLLLGETPRSRYEGFFFYDQEEGEMYRIIEDIRLGSSYSPEEIIDHSDFIERQHKKVSELFHMPQGKPALVYNLSKDLDIRLTLDMKRSYDNRSYGRFYEIAKEGNAIVVTFTKKTDAREDPSEGREEFRLYLVIYAEDIDFSFINHWIERDYDLDRKRGSFPDRRFILDALRLRVKRCVFYAGKDKKRCYREAKKLFRSHTDLRETRKRHHEYDDIKDLEHKLALYRAQRSLLGNLVNEDDLFAGQPWFFQFWARDTAYSLPGLQVLGKNKIVERLIHRHLERIDYQGYIPNRTPASDSESADAIGIFADRIGRLLGSGYRPTKASRKTMQDRLQHSCYLLTKFKMKDGLAVNKPKETWMDTDFKGDDRSGRRIEIQALRMRLYEVMDELTGGHEYERLIQDMKKKVRRGFYRKGMLYDAPDDPTQRPNIFLAAYFFQRLFKPKEWVEIIDHAIQELWLDWGGFSSISKKHPFFTDTHTGEDIKSYHRGDSWYFINNIAAIVMLRIDRHRYKDFIEKVIDASTKDILWGGVIGHPSELSSAKRQTFEGCLSQTWSSATYLELLHDYYLLNKA